jgi:hypothetical protein
MPYYKLFIIYFNASFFLLVRADRFQKPCRMIWDMMELCHIIAYQNKNYTFPWLNTLHVTSLFRCIAWNADIDRSKNRAWTGTTGLYTDMCLFTMLLIISFYFSFYV